MRIYKLDGNPSTEAYLQSGVLTRDIHPSSFSVWFSFSIVMVLQNIYKPTDTISKYDFICSVWKKQKQTAPVTREKLSPDWSSCPRSSTAIWTISTKSCSAIIQTYNDTHDDVQIHSSSPKKEVCCKNVCDIFSSWVCTWILDSFIIKCFFIIQY